MKVNAVPPMKLNENVEQAVQSFLEYHDVGEAKRRLRKMLLQYLRTESAVVDREFKDLLYDLDGIFDLLDVMEDQSPN